MFGYRVDRQARGHFARVMATHPVGDDTQPKRFVDQEAVFVDLSDAAFVRYAVRAQHA